MTNVLTSETLDLILTHLTLLTDLIHIISLFISPNSNYTTKYPEIFTDTTTLNIILISIQKYTFITILKLFWTIR